MSRRSLVMLIVAIVAVHCILLWILFGLRTATETAEKEIKELRSAAKSTGNEIAELDKSKEKLSGGKPGAQSAGAASGKKPGVSMADRSAYVRKPKNMTPVKFDYTASGGRINTDKLNLESRATAGILIDMDTKKVLWSKNPTKEIPIASLTKIMTIMLSYEIAVDEASPYTLKTMIPVTPEAIRTEPSKVDFKKGEEFSIDELLLAASVRSANDAAHLLAEHIGCGDAARFIEDMNRRAKEIGMTHTVYFNAHGLPGKSREFDNHSTPEDLARLCLVFRQYPHLMNLAGLRTAPFREKGSPGYQLLENHNNLLPGGKKGTLGVNGIKTGYTKRAGCCVAATCTRSGHNLLAVVTGFPSSADRDNFVQLLLDWGYEKIGVPKTNGNSSSAKKTTTEKGR